MAEIRPNGHWDGSPVTCVSAQVPNVNSPVVIGVLGLGDQVHISLTSPVPSQAPTSVGL